MIKVFYSGWGLIGTVVSNKDIEFDNKPTFFRIVELCLVLDDLKILEEFGFVDIYALESIKDHEKQPAEIGRQAILIIDKDGSDTPITITKAQTIHRHENGNTLKLIFDDNAPTIQVKSEPIEKPLSESGRATLYKIIYGMAIDAHGYDPQKTHNDATGNNKDSISSRLQTHGIDVTNRTIQEIIKKAKKYVR